MLTELSATPTGPVHPGHLSAAGLAGGLIGDDEVGWFARTSREAALLGAFEATLDELERRLGPDMATWTWGRLHQIRLPHVLFAASARSSGSQW